jgi:hypothetical protein
MANVNESFCLYSPALTRANSRHSVADDHNKHTCAPELASTRMSLLKTAYLDIKTCHFDEVLAERIINTKLNLPAIARFIVTSHNRNLGYSTRKSKSSATRELYNLS